MKILLTGFNRFGKLKSNPSQLVVEHFAAHATDFGLNTLTAEVLPTEFARASRRIAQLIRKIRPDLIICLGVAQGIDGIHLERVALNLDDAEAPDNSGSARQGKLIRPEGPPAYWSTLPLERMKAALERRRIAARISNHAGTYVCNHVFYIARHEVERLHPRSLCGFIHLPSISSPRGKKSPRKPGLPLKVILEAVEICLKSAQGSAS